MMKKKSDILCLQLMKENSDGVVELDKRLLDLMIPEDLTFNLRPLKENENYKMEIFESSEWVYEAFSNNQDIKSFDNFTNLGFTRSHFNPLSLHQPDYQKLNKDDIRIKTIQDGYYHILSKRALYKGKQIYTMSNSFDKHGRIEYSFIRNEEEGIAINRYYDYRNMMIIETYDGGDYCRIFCEDDFLLIKNYFILLDEDGDEIIGKGFFDSNENVKMMITIIATDEK